MEDQTVNDTIGQDGLDRTKFDIGFDANPPTVMLVSIPLKMLAADEENGKALLIGKMEGIKNRAIKMIDVLRARKAQAGISGPDGAPLRSPSDVIQ